MKGKRQGIVIDDFSGGQITKSSLIGIDKKYSPDCLNVYSEGKTLRKRNGITVVNATAVTGSPSGNGIYNWIQSAGLQYLFTAFGTATYSMNTSNGWTGTLTAVSNDSANGTSFSDSIRHFVTYNGTLIMTNEVRDKPQYMRITDTSHFNIEYLGAGTGPQGKYCQVWKNHLWILNIGQGGTLTEDCDGISNWTDNDTGTGNSSQTTFSGSSTFRFLGGTNSGDSANRQRTMSGGIPDDYTIATRNYFALLTSTATGNIAAMNIRNGVINNQIRWSSSDGIQVNDGTNWNQVGVNLATQSTFAIWKFIVTGGTATAARVDILKDGLYVGLQYPIMAATTASDGQINLQALSGATTSRADWYMDYLYINSSTPVTDRILNGGMETWTGGLPTGWNVYPTQPLTHFRMNDNAANTTVTNSGSETSNGVSSVNTNLLSSSGKISNSFSFTSASSHLISLASATVTSMSDDAVGTLSMWLYVNGGVSAQSIFSIGNTTANSIATLETVGDGRLLFAVNPVFELFIPSASFPTGTFNHLAITQNATSFKVFVNAVDTSYTVETGTGSQGIWFSSVSSANVARIGCRNYFNLGNTNFFNGKIDDFRYYSSALSSLEIASIYAEGNGNEAIVGVVQEGTTTKLGSNSLRINSTGEYTITSQVMSTGSALAGVSSIVGLWAFVTNNATYKIRCTAGTANTDSAVLTGNGTWQYQTLRFTPSSGETSIGVQMITTSSATVYFDHVSVIATSTGIVTDNSDRLQRSAFDTYNDWSGTDSGNNDITTPGDIGLSGSGILNDRMYIFKKWSIHRITYTGSTPLLDIKQAKSTVGTTSPRSIKNFDIPGKGEVLIFLGSDKRVYYFDGYETVAISDDISISNGISDIYMNNINGQALDKVWAAVYTDLNWYELFIPTGSNTIPDSSIIFDFSGDKVAFWPNNNRNFLSGAISDNGLGVRVVYAQHNTNGTAYLTVSSNSDAGSAINGYWTSFKVGSPVLLGRMDEIEVQTDSIAVTPTLKWRMDWENSWISKTLNANSYSHNYSPDRIDNLAQFYLVDNTTAASFKIWSMGIYERVLGGGK